MEEKKHIGALFDRIAGTYDRFNHLLSLNIDRSWRRKAVKSLRPCEKLLDVAVGTADLTLEVLRRDKAAHVTGLDLSEKMMEIGRRKIARKGWSHRAELLCGSALEMSFPDASFDAVTCAYGVRNFSDLDKGLSEMFRVLKPGGQLVILEFSYPSHPLVRGLYDVFFTHLMPLAGRLGSKDPDAYRYFRQSVKNFIWGKEMADRIRSAGFTECRFRPLSFGITTLYTATRLG